MHIFIIKIAIAGLNKNEIWKWNLFNGFPIRTASEGERAKRQEAPEENFLERKKHSMEGNIQISL